MTAAAGQRCLIEIKSLLGDIFRDWGNFVSPSSIEFRMAERSSIPSPKNEKTLDTPRVYRTAVAPYSTEKLHILSAHYLVGSNIAKRSIFPP